MATEVRAFESGGILYKSLEEARTAELSDALRRIFQHTPSVSVGSIVKRCKEILKVLEQYAVEDRLLGGSK